MPDVKPLRFPSREEPPDGAELESVCSGRRRARAFLSTPLPSVSSALAHIRELRAQVLGCGQQSGKLEARLYPEPERDGPALSQGLHTKCPGFDALMSTQLFVQGVAISTRESCPLAPAVKRVQDVLEEVVYLMERLEAERQSAEESLRRERRRKVFLETDLESISARKQQECDSIVERERELCRRDISDLKRQIQRSTASLDRVRGARSDSTVLNRRFREDVDRAREQVMTLKEQLDHQDRLMQDVLQRQAEADEEYSRVHSHLLALQEEMKELELQTNSQKELMNQELQVLKTELACQVAELQRLEERERHLSAQIREAEEAVGAAEQKSAAMGKEIPQLEASETEQKLQMSRLTRQLADEVQVSRTLEEELAGLKQKLEEAKRRGEAEVSLSEEQLSSKRRAHAALRSQHLEWERSVDEHRRKISQSEEAVEQMLERRKQMLQRISDNDEQRGRAREELTRVLARLAVSRAHLEEQERRAFLRDRRAREELQSLRGDLSGRVALREQLQGQCAQMAQQLQEQRRSSALVTQELRDEFDAARSATESLQARLQSMKTRRAQLDSMESDHQAQLAQLQRELELNLEQLSAVKDIEAASALRSQRVLGAISRLQREREDLRLASAAVEDELARTPEVISKLQRAHDVAESKDRSAALLVSTVRSDLNRCRDRARRSVRTHAAHIAARARRRDAAKEALTLALNDHKRLAAEYQDLRTLRAEHQREAGRVLGASNAAQKSLHDYTQLSLLQKRMHKALVKHFRRRSLHIQSELDRCQSLSQETDQKMRAAQERLSAELRSISALLASGAGRGRGDAPGARTAAHLYQTTRRPPHASLSPSPPAADP